MDDFVKANPKLVSKISYSQAPAPELPGKIKAQQDAGRLDIDLVLIGTDVLSAGHHPENVLFLAGDRLYRRAAGPEIDLSAGCAKDAGIGRGSGGVRGVLLPASGPLLEYMPDAVKSPPKTAKDLLAWTVAASEAVHVCAAGQFGAGADVPARPAVYPGRYRSEGPEGRLGEDPGNTWPRWARTSNTYPTGTGAAG